jgi:hypothetical protein
LFRAKDDVFLTNDAFPPEFIQCILRISTREVLYWGDYYSMDRQLADEVYRQNWWEPRTDKSDTSAKEADVSHIIPSDGDVAPAATTVMFEPGFADVDFGDDEVAETHEDPVADNSAEQVRQEVLAASQDLPTSKEGDKNRGSKRRRRDDGQRCPACREPFGNILARDQCLTCGHVLVESRKVENLSTEVDAALQPRVVNTTRAGRSKEAVTRRMAKDYLKRAKQFGYDSILDRFNKDERFNKQMADQGHTKESIEVFDTQAVTKLDPKPQRSREDMESHRHNFWADKQGQYVDRSQGKVYSKERGGPNEKSKMDGAKAVVRTPRQHLRKDPMAT